MSDPSNQIPHWLWKGQSFSLFDRISIPHRGKTGEAEYRVRGTEPFLRGHFPGEPLVPGVVLVEAVAQLARLVAESSTDTRAKRPLELSFMRRIKILASARPQELIHFEACVTSRKPALIQMEGRILVGGREILSAEMVFKEVGDGTDSATSCAS